MTVEELFVDAFDDTFLDWVEAGDSPYLNDSTANSITEDDLGTDKEGYFDFANSAVGAGTINSVKVSLECRYSNAGYVKKFKLFVWNGSAWIDFGEVTPTVQIPSYAWVDVDVSSEIDSWAKINGCRIYVEEVSYDSSLAIVRIRRCKLKIDYTVGGVSHSETVTDLLGMTDSTTKTAAFHVTPTDILGMVDTKITLAAYHITLTDILGMTDTVIASKISIGVGGHTKTTLTFTW